MKPRTRPAALVVWAASGYLFVYWLPLVHERCILAPNWLSGGEGKLLRTSTQTRESGRKTIIRQK